MPTLEQRSVRGISGKQSSIRLEPELWAEMEKAITRLNITINDFVCEAERRFPTYGRTHATRAYVVVYLAERIKILEELYDVGIGPDTPTLERMF